MKRYVDGVFMLTHWEMCVCNGLKRRDAWEDRAAATAWYGGKWCTCCKVWKKVADFRTRRGAMDGLASRCRTCERAAIVTWESLHPEKVKAYQKTYREKYRDEINRRKRERRQEVKLALIGGETHD